MNVVLLDLGPTLRGGQRQVYYLARFLARLEGVRSLTACPARSGLAALLAGEGLPLLALPGRAAWNPLLLPPLLTALAGPEKTILHTHDAHAASLGALLKRLRPGILLVHSRRVSYVPSRGSGPGKYARADVVVGVSAEITALMTDAGVPRDRVRTIHSGIDPSRYSPKVPRNGGRFVFLSVGALTPQKGYGVLLDALALLRRTDLPAWEARIVGGGPLEAELREKTRSLGLGDHLTLTGWKDARDELPLADAVVVPSVDGEGSSAAVKEGWATGLPVVCTALPSNTELIADGDNGLLVPPGDPRSLALAMQRCLTGPELRSRLVRGGTRSLPAFTDTRMAHSYLELYRELAGESPA